MVQLPNYLVCLVREAGIRGFGDHFSMLTSLMLFLIVQPLYIYAGKQSEPAVAANELGRKLTTTNQITPSS